jgi:hypothetical protein
VRSISSRQLSDLLRGVDAGEIAVVLDSCHSAASIERAGFKPGPFGNRGFGQLAYDKRMLLLAAARPEQVALEHETLGHGFLTYALLQSLKEPQPGAGKPLTFARWFELAAGKMPKLLAAAIRGKRPVSGGARALRLVRKAAEQSPVLFDFSAGRGKAVLVRLTR